MILVKQIVAGYGYKNCAGKFAETKETDQGARYPNPGR